MPLLVLSVQEPEVGLKRVCASALSDISKHSQELAHTVAAEGAVPHLSKMLTHRDAKLKRQVGACLSNIAKHNVDLAEAVVEYTNFDSIEAYEHMHTHVGNARGYTDGANNFA